MGRFLRAESFYPAAGENVSSFDDRKIIG